MKTWRIARRNNLEADFNESYDNSDYEENTVEASFNNKSSDNDHVKVMEDVEADETDPMKDMLPEVFWHLAYTDPIIWTKICDLIPVIQSVLPGDVSHHLCLLIKIQGVPEKNSKCLPIPIIIEQTLGAFLSFSEK